MGKTIFFVLAALAVAAAMAFALWLVRHKKQTALITPLNVLVAGVAAAGVLLFLPAYFVQQTEDLLQPLKGLLLAIYSTMRLFLGDGDYTVLQDGFGDTPILTCYMALMSVLQVLAPMLTASAIIAVFSNLSAHMQYLRQRGKDACVFSELNSESLALARDLRKNHPQTALIFAAVHPEETEQELKQEALGLNAVLFRKHMEELPLEIHNKDRSLWLFTISENEQSNVAQGLELVERYGNRERTNLYVFANSTESELLFSAYRDKAMRIRRINLVRSAINRMLYDEGTRLFRDALPQEDGSKLITAVIVGMGEYGTHMLKTLTWFCQMDGYRVRLHAFDEAPLAKQRFAAQCPELMDEQYNGVQVPGEACYTIKFHRRTPVDTTLFTDQILKIPEATYVLVDLGSDEKNIETAVNLRMLFERIGAKPVIQAVVHSDEKRKAILALQEILEAEEQKQQAKGKIKHVNHRLELIGNLEHACSENVIIDSELEADALCRHLRWGSEPEFWAVEYNYRSSIALSIAAKTRKDLGIPGADKEEKQLTEEERIALESLEHRRWNAYMRSEGYVFSGSTDPKSRNDLAKMHHDLVDYQSLPEGEKRKDSLVGTD